MITPEEKLLRLAEAWGIPRSEIRYITGRGLIYLVKTERGIEEREVPNYLRDHNAIAELVANANAIALPLLRYHEILVKRHENLGATIATAEQRADAILEAMGK